MTTSATSDSGEVLILVGTAKGAFIFRGDRRRVKWELTGPFFRGSAVYALAHDERGDGRSIWSSATSMHWGATLHVSQDFGRTWSMPEESLIKFPPDTEKALAQIWQITPGAPNDPDTLYCGVEPAALFKSADGGETWALVRGLYDHPHRPEWMPGGGGLCLHTILVDPDDPRRLMVAISTGGVYRSEDGGAKWQARNTGVRAEFLPEKYPEFGQCVHKIVSHPSCPERLFLQNHWGLYRSDDRGDHWIDIANGVPSDFGFAMEIDPHDPDTVYIVPIESDEFRVAAGRSLRVYVTRDAGASWAPLADGLPDKDAFETVLRDALNADTLEPAGLYFGTRSGKLFALTDRAAGWRLVHENLPPILCVRTAVLKVAQEITGTQQAEAAATLDPERDRALTV